MDDYRYLPSAMMLLTLIVAGTFALARLYLGVLEKRKLRDKHSSGIQLYPRPRRDRKHIHRYKVKYECTYDGATTEWTGYYHFKTWAVICAWWNCHISAWTGTAILYDRRYID